MSAFVREVTSQIERVKREHEREKVRETKREWKEELKSKEICFGK